MLCMRVIMSRVQLYTRNNINTLMWNRAAFDKIEVLNMKTLDAPTIEAPRDIPCAHCALIPRQNEPHTPMPVFYYINGDL